MARYLLQRFAALVFVVFIITVFCFLLVHLLPGDPATAILGTAATAHSKAVLDAYLGLNKPLPVQYWIWLDNVLHGNLGYSNFVGSIRAMLQNSYRYDLELVLYSQVIAFAISIPLSVHAARRAGGKLDQGASTVTFAFYCLPAFILSLWLVQLFCFHWTLLPGPGSDPFPSGVPLWDQILTNLKVMFLPAVILSIGSIALYYRLLRGEMVATLQEEFITVARSKGLKTGRIMWRHALRPSSVTMLASAGNSIAILLTGLFVVENKMNFPGIGVQLLNAINAPDYLTVQAIALVTAVTVVVVNFGIDIILTFVDPRITRA